MTDLVEIPVTKYQKCKTAELFAAINLVVGGFLIFILLKFEVCTTVVVSFGAAHVGRTGRQAASTARGRYFLTATRD